MEVPEPHGEQQGFAVEQVSNPANQERITTLDLIDLLEMTEETYRLRFRGTPILRAKRVGLQRNACVALGNKSDTVAVPALRQALVVGEPLVRGHAAWALGRIGGTEVWDALNQAQDNEGDEGVLAEIGQALTGFNLNNR